MFNRNHGLNFRFTRGQVILVFFTLIFSTLVSGETTTVLERPANMEDITMTGNPDSTWVVTRSEEISGEPHAVYRLSVDVRTQHDQGRVLISVRQIRANGNSISYAGGISLTPSILDYTRYSSVFVAHEAVERLQVYYRLNQVSGTASFRNLVLEKLTGEKAREVLAEFAVPPVYFSLPVYVYSDETSLDWGYRVNSPISPEAEQVAKIVMESAAHEFRVEIEPVSGRQIVETAKLQFDEGVHQLTARAFDQAGQVLTEETRELRSFNRPVRRQQVPVRQVKIDEGNYLSINGQPVFPIGIYHVWRKRDIELIREQGFNIAQIWSGRTGESGFDGFRQFMDWAADEGLMAWAATKSNAMDDDRLRTLINTLKGHPALALWCLVDEPMIRNISPATVRAKAEIIRELDDTPTYISFSNQSAAVQYEGAFDIVATHRYPLPFQEVTEVGRVLDVLARDFADRLPYLATLQAWMSPNDPTFREHSPEEIRAMTYLAIIHGAKGVSYYSFQSGTWRLINYPRLWSIFKGLTWELESLTEVILTGNRIGEITVSSPEISFVAIEYEGDRYILAVNTAREEISTNISVDNWEQFNYWEKFRFGEQPTPKTVTGNQFELVFSPLQTVVLKLVE